MPERQPMPADVAAARKGRLVAIVVAATVVLWLGAQAIGGQLGLPPRYVFLFDFAAIGAFIWALAVTYQLWQARSSTRPPNGG